MCQANIECSTSFRSVIRRRESKAQPLLRRVAASQWTRRCLRRGGKMPKIKIQRGAEVYHNGEVEIEVQRDYQDLADQSDQIVRDIVKAYPKTKRLYESIMSDPRIMAQWDLANYIAVVKLGFNDHGPIHAQVVAAAAMQMMQLLLQRGVGVDVIQSGAGDLDDAHAVVLAGILLHDIGNQIHRVNHEAFSLTLAQPIVERHFAPIYTDPEQLQTMIGFTLSTIACHDCNPPPLTMEGAVVAVADATDMTKGLSL